MKASEYSLYTNRTARYCTLGDLSSATTDIWLVIHGYGQLAAYFIRNFEVLLDENTLIVAPEGLSRFYLDSKYDRVGASWMTKESRISEIEDNKNYLDALLQTILSGTAHGGSVRLNLFGFSQGVSTLWRWASTLQVPIHQIILWGGYIPADTDNQAVALSRARILFAYGNDDPIIHQNPALFENQRKIIENLTFPACTNWEYEGAHNIPAKALSEALNILQKLGGTK